MQHGFAALHTSPGRGAFNGGVLFCKLRLQIGRTCPQGRANPFGVGGVRETGSLTPPQVTPVEDGECEGQKPLMLTPEQFKHPIEASHVL